MNPDNTYQPEADLPKPMSGGSEVESASRAPVNSAETASFAAELPQHSPVVPAQHQAALPALPTDPAPVLQNSQAATITSTPTPSLAATDTDLIEKEWITKAKAIIEKTKDNPHEQTRDMSKFKADYVKKRYNKELKVSEG